VKTFIRDKLLLTDNYNRKSDLVKTLDLRSKVVKQYVDWQYVALVIILWRLALSASLSSSSAFVTALRWEPVNVHV